MKKNQTHCKYGHEFTEENTTFTTDGKGHKMRRCKICNRQRSKNKTRNNKVRGALSIYL